MSISREMRVVLSHDVSIQYVITYSSDPVLLQLLYVSSHLPIRCFLRSTCRYFCDLFRDLSLLFPIFSVTFYLIFVDLICMRKIISLLIWRSTSTYIRLQSAYCHPSLDPSEVLSLRSLRSLFLHWISLNVCKLYVHKFHVIMIK